MVEFPDIKLFLIFYTVGISGFLCSIVSLVFVIKKPVLHNAFGYICGAHSIAEAGVLFIFVFWCPFITIWREQLEENIVTVIMGHLLNYFYYSTIYFHLLKSVNRFCAIVFSIKYRIWFSDRIVKILITLIFIICIFHTAPLFMYDCNVLFRVEVYRWIVRDPICEATITSYHDFIMCCTSMSISLICDIITFCFFRIRLKKANSNTRNDIKFAAHAFVTTLLYTSMIFSFYILSSLSDNLWILFITTNLAWMLCHGLNQMSFIVFISFLHRQTNVKEISIKVQSESVNKNTQK